MSPSVAFFFNGTPLILSTSLGSDPFQFVDEMKLNAESMIINGMRAEKCSSDELADIFHAQLVGIERELFTRSQPSGYITDKVLRELSVITTSGDVKKLKSWWALNILALMKMGKLQDDDMNGSVIIDYW